MVGLGRWWCCCSLWIHYELNSCLRIFLLAYSLFYHLNLLFL